MKSIGTFFFILTPFGLFCTENGTGLVVGTLFFILGIVCKCIGNDTFGRKTKVNSKDWWETNYRINMAQNRGHEASKGIADYTTSSNHFPMPSEEEKEQIVKSMGVVSEKAKQDIIDHWDRIQVGKHYLMGELMEKYKDYLQGDKCRKFVCPVYYIKASREALKFVWSGSVGGYNTIERFDKTDIEMWNSLSINEKNEVKEWIREYEERFLKEVHDCLENNVEMPTIAKHYNHDGHDIYNFNIKYGFTRSMTI